MKKNNTKDLDKTKQILFGLSDLMSNFYMKVLQHHEMTETSIYINIKLKNYRITYHNIILFSLFLFYLTYFKFILIYYSNEFINTIR